MLQAIFRLPRQARRALPALALLLAACGGATQPPAVPPAAQVPTSAPTAARPTQTPPAAAPAPTATTAPSPTTPAAADELRTAFDRVAELDSYRVAFTSGATIEGGTPLLDYSAAFNGPDVAFRFTLPPESGGQQQTLDVITAGGVTYARGPLPVPGAEQPVWYTLGTSPPSATTPPFTAGRLAELLTERIDLADLAPDGEEEIDGATCTRYRGGLDVALGMMDSFGTPTTPEATAAEATPVVERMQAQGFTFGESSALVWVCGDGALRRVRAKVSGTSPQQPGGPFTIQTGLDLTEAGEPITIEPPVEPITPGTVVPVGSVFNGGNVRAQPNLQGEVRDQINAGEAVRLLGRNADASWYQIVNARDVVGWVSATLLTVAPADAALVPVAPVP